ncbi:long-tail fiber protein [Pectobacterium phage Wc4-1]|uniref:Long-tail fiber protein n=1 Tax=Pectobacterium phage Wc4 TaxID=2652428 RepID=A0A5P8D5B8_9CAUD|nr:long-tail fiber protein [Pectobacterium phage Wc4]QFP93996.1 long-tail fiber protein [Pectobacterium phage Wc4-1]
MALPLGSIQIQALPAANPTDGTELLHIKQGNSDRRATILEAIKPFTDRRDNPLEVTKFQVQLGNVTNDAQLKVSQNLADVPDKAAARANLEIYSKDEANANLAAHIANPDPHTQYVKKVDINQLQNWTYSGDYTEAANKYATIRAVNNLFLAIQRQYPIDSLHISMNPANPSTYLLVGGAWVLESKGRALVGFNDGDTSRPAGNLFGASSKQISVQNLPAHSHTVTLAGGAHSHRVQGNTANGGNHTHNSTGTTDQFNYGTVNGSTGAAGGHTHTGTTDVSGSHRHDIKTTAQRMSIHDIWGTWFQGYFDRVNQTEPAGEHSHNITLNPVGDHAHSVSVNIGAHSHTFSVNTTQSGEHVHGIDIQSSSTEHVHSGTTDSTGNNVAFNVEQPSMVVYIWRRIA